MFGLFKKDPVKKLEKERNRVLADAMEAQRSGDLKTYGELTERAEALADQIAELRNQQ